MEVNSNIYEAVRKAIFQLNAWIVSIESVLQESLDLDNENRTKIFNEQRINMKFHQDCLRRIVKICQDQSVLRETSKMDIINEYITFVSERFEKLQGHVEMAIKANESELFKKHLNAVIDKVNIYNKMLDSLCYMITTNTNTNTNNPARRHKTATQLQKMKSTFNHYLEEVERVLQKSKKLNETDFEELGTQVESLSMSLKLIEASIEQHWKVVNEHFKPCKIHCLLQTTELTEYFDCLTLLPESKLHNSECITVDQDQYAVPKFVQDKIQPTSFSSEVQIMCSENEVMEFKWNAKIVNWIKHISQINLGSHTFTVEPIKIYTQSCNIHYLERELSLHKVASSRNSETSRKNICLNFSKVCKMRVTPKRIKIICRKPEIFDRRQLQNDSIYTVQNHPYSTAIFKCGPRNGFLRFLSTSLDILVSKTTELDAKLYKHMRQFESSHLNIFETEYEFLSERYSIDALVYIKNIYDENERYNAKSSELSAASFPKKYHEDFMNEFFHELSSAKYLNARASLASPVIKFFTQHFKFDIGLCSVLIIQKVLFHVINTLKIDNLIRSIGGVNQYRLMSATI